jgi:hypothetical protein
MKQIKAVKILPLRKKESAGKNMAMRVIKAFKILNIRN